jgi:hypothetical protein
LVEILNLILLNDSLLSSCVTSTFVLYEQDGGIFDPLDHLNWQGYNHIWPINAQQLHSERVNARTKLINNLLVSACLNNFNPFLAENEID